jgi:hypothetical protein
LSCDLDRAAVEVTITEVLTKVRPEPKGRGAQPASRPGRALAVKRIKGRTVYLPDDLFERILVQAHRKDLTISDYVTMLLDRHVPDHRRIGPASAAEQGDTEAA